MKKYLICMLITVIIYFAIPIIFTNTSKETNTNTTENIENNQIISNYDYKKYNTVKLLHTSTKKVEELKLDEYLYGVVSSEMPASFEEEALKAQAVVARTYTLYKIVNSGSKHKNADICDSSTCCQAWISKENRLKKWDSGKREEYWTKIVNAVNETQGKIVIYEGKPINAFFHSNSGGYTEAPINVWGGSGYPYLKSVQTAGEDAYSQYASKLTITKKEFEEKIKKEHSNFDIDFTKEDCVKVEEYTEGNRIKSIKIGNLNLSGVEVRTLFGLRSANFKITIEKEKITFEVTGYGHGVGMSQTGADSLAKQGKNYEEIICHYYTGVKVEDI